MHRGRALLQFAGDVEQPGDEKLVFEPHARHPAAAGPDGNGSQEQLLARRLSGREMADSKDLMVIKNKWDFLGTNLSVVATLVVTNLLWLSCDACLKWSRPSCESVTTLVRRRHDVLGLCRLRHDSLTTWSRSHHDVVATPLRCLSEVVTTFLRLLYDGDMTC